MKKFSIILTLLLLVIPFSANAYGEIIGNYVNTDIVAYINEQPINSYNINGWTGIVAEDLTDYGFDVYWDGDARTLTVGHSYIPTPQYTEQNWQGNGTVKTNIEIKNNIKPIGSFAGYIYSTDIKTYVAGEEVTAFNIGGRTIIYIDELQYFGSVKWYEKERKICYNYVSPWNIDLYKTDYSAETKENIDGFSLKTEKGENGEYKTRGENLDYLDYLKLSYNKKDGMYFGFSIYQRVLFQTDELYQKLWNISTEAYDGTMLLDSADLANEQMKIKINGTPVLITKVTQGKGNGHSDFYFWLDSTLEKEQITSFEVEF